MPPEGETKIDLLAHGPFSCWQKRTKPMVVYESFSQVSITSNMFDEVIPFDEDDEESSPLAKRSRLNFPLCKTIEKSPLKAQNEDQHLAGGI